MWHCARQQTAGTLGTAIAAATALAAAGATHPDGATIAVAAAVLVCRVPGLKTKLTAADMAVLDAGDISWVSGVQLLAQQQLLLVMFQVRTVHIRCVLRTYSSSSRSVQRSWRSASTGAATSTPER
jgi:hypothetical protein